MATKLFLRSTTTNGIGPTYRDMVTAAGAASTTAVVNTVASGTEIQWTSTAGGAVIQWVSGRTPAAGFTLTTTDISIWAHESDMAANIGGRYKVFHRSAAGVETEIGGGPFSDGIEFGTAAAEMLWAGNTTDQAFVENDRILLKLYITNVGTMGGPFTGTLTFNAADAATGDSFFNIAETITFKAEAPDSWMAQAGQVVRRVGLLTSVAVASGLFMPPPQPAPETVTLDKWYASLSEPTRAKRKIQPDALTYGHYVAGIPGTGTAFPSGVSGPPPSLKRFQYQAVVRPVDFTTPETTTPDKWHRPLAEPVRVRVTIGPGLQQATAFVAPVIASGWEQPLSKPVLRGGLPTSQQQAVAFVQAAPFAETVSLDKWLLPLAEPRRFKPALPTGQQQSFAFVKADPFAEATNTGKWYSPLGEPSVKRRAAIAQQQSFVFAQTEDVTVAKWLTPFSEPRRSRPQLRTGHQQYTALVQAAPFAESVSADRWAYQTSQPTLAKRQTQPDAVSYAPYVAPAAEDVTLDKWARPFSEPVRKVQFTAQQQYTALVKAAPFAESVRVDGWLQSLAEPKRFKQPVAYQQPASFWPYPLPNLDAPVGYYSIYPDRARRNSLPVADQQYTALVQAEPFAEITTAEPQRSGFHIVRLRRGTETDEERRHRVFSEMVDELESAVEKQTVPVAKLARKARLAKPPEIDAERQAEWTEFFATLRRIERLEDANAVAQAKLAALRQAYRIEAMLALRLKNDEEAMILLMMS